MDWTALWLSLTLCAVTVVMLLPIGVICGRFLAYQDFAGKGLVEAAVALPLILPPTVIGYYLLVVFGATSPLGQIWRDLTGQPLAFSFEGLVLASIIFNLPFAIQPMQRGFESIHRDIRDAAACCGMSPAKILLQIELPLAWPSILTAMVLTFAHTLGEFGIVLMVGGSISGETRTIAISIYDRVQAFDNVAAAEMSALLLALSMISIGLVFTLSRRISRSIG